ncbi:MAG: hypothetical protein PHO64_10330, partial [Thiomonas sp.]|nr:hypothetical protein [Thiomonas sp.]
MRGLPNLSKNVDDMLTLYRVQQLRVARRELALEAAIDRLDKFDLLVPAARRRPPWGWTSGSRCWCKARSPGGT